jgi:molybdenum cofactor biosynthesis enzyme MoaA
LGTELVPYELAKKFAISHQIKNQREWRKLFNQKKLPVGFPSNPNQRYKKWKGWYDFLETKRIYKNYVEAKEFALKNKIKTQYEWYQWSKSKKIPSYFPSRPEDYYKKEWTHWKDFLNTERKFKSYIEASNYAKKNKIIKQKLWFKHTKSNKFPVDIPVYPNEKYKEWTNWGSFLQTGKSYANDFDKYQTDFDTVNIQEINVKANNICNLACRSCGPHFSSQWEKEFSTVIKITKDNLVFEKLKLLDIQSLKKIVIAGGEPTLAQDHVSLLQMLLQLGHTNVEIRIATNLTSLKYKETDLVSLWQKFPRLILHISIDAVGNQAKNIRSGTDWDSVSNNLDIIVNSGINHYVMTTVSALNIWFLEATVAHLKKNHNVRQIEFNPLVGPEELSIQVIPDEYRYHLKGILDRCTDLGVDVTQVKTYFNNSDHRPDLWTKFLIYNLILDHTRKEDFFGSLPIKKHLIEQWIKL